MRIVVLLSLACCLALNSAIADSTSFDPIWLDDLETLDPTSPEAQAAFDALSPGGGTGGTQESPGIAGLDRDAAMNRFLQVEANAWLEEHRDPLPPSGPVMPERNGGFGFAEYGRP